MQMRVRPLQSKGEKEEEISLNFWPLAGRCRLQRRQQHWLTQRRRLFFAASFENLEKFARECAMS